MKILVFFFLSFLSFSTLAQDYHTPFITTKGKCGYGKTMPSGWVIDDKSIPAPFCDCGDFRGNVAAVAIQKKRQLKYGLINTKGNKILAFEYDLVIVGCLGRVLVKKLGKWGIVDTLGESILACTYDSIILAKDIILVQNNHQWQVLNTPQLYDDVLSISDTLPTLIVKKQGLWGLLGRTTCKYDSLIYEYLQECIILRNSQEKLLYHIIEDTIMPIPVETYIYQLPAQWDKYANNIRTILLSTRKDTIYYTYEDYIHTYRGHGAEYRDFFFYHLQSYYVSKYKSYYPIHYYTKLTILTNCSYERGYFMLYPRNLIHKKNDNSLVIGILDSFAKEVLPLNRYKSWDYIGDSLIYYRSPHQIYGYVLDLNTRKTVGRMTRRLYEKKYNK